MPRAVPTPTGDSADQAQAHLSLEFAHTYPLATVALSFNRCPNLRANAQKNCGLGNNGKGSRSRIASSPVPTSSKQGRNIGVILRGFRKLQPQPPLTALNTVTTITIRMCRRCWNVIPAKIFTGLRNVLLNFCNGKHYPVSHGHRREVVMIFMKRIFQ